MKNIFNFTALFTLTLGVGAFSSITTVEADTISNPKCIQGLREAQSRNGYQAFAMVPGGKYCGWTIQSSSSQAEANRIALHYCKYRAQGQKCYVAWPN